MVTLPLGQKARKRLKILVIKIITVYVLLHCSLDWSKKLFDIRIIVYTFPVNKSDLLL